MKAFGFLLLFVYASAIGVAQTKQKTFQADAFLKSASLESATVSASFIDIETHEEIFSINPKTSAVPASIFKLVTTSSALEILGKDFRFTTTLYAKGSVADRVLNGDLIVMGGGDPTLGSSYFNIPQKEFLPDWVQQIKQSGIDSISGNIIVDPYIYKDQDVPQTWIWEDMGNYYGAAAHGISLYDNRFDLYFDTEDIDGGSTKIVKIDPEIPDLQITNMVKASSIKSDQSYVFGSSFDSFREIRGSLPKGRKSYKVGASIPDPSILLGNELKNRLCAEKMIDKNQEVQKEAIADIDTIKFLKIYEHQSPTLAQIVAKTNFYSVNLFAEHLCKHIGLKALGEGSTVAGCKAIESYWKLQGVGTKGLFVVDGSGLSHFDAISASTMAKMLVSVKQKSYFQSFKEAIPLAGKEGTVAKYFTNLPVKGHARIKTGSMMRVRSFAGYITTSKGSEIAFAVIVNNYMGNGTEAIKMMEQLINYAYLNY